MVEERINKIVNDSPSTILKVILTSQKIKRKRETVKKRHTENSIKIIHIYLSPLHTEELLNWKNSNTFLGEIKVL